MGHTHHKYIHTEACPCCGRVCVCVQGNKKNMPEGSNMWGTLTTETFTPWLEFDFIYLDAWDSGVLGKSRVGVNADVSEM